MELEPEISKMGGSSNPDSTKHTTALIILQFEFYKLKIRLSITRLKRAELCLFQFFLGGKRGNQKDVIVIKMFYFIHIVHVDISKFKKNKNVFNVQ